MSGRPHGSGWQRQTIGNQAVELRYVEDASFRSGDMLDKFSVSLVAMIAKTVAIKFGKKGFAVGEMRQMQMKKRFKSGSTNFQCFEALARYFALLVVPDEIVSYLFAFKDSGSFEDS